MRHIVATLIVAVMLVLVSGSIDVHGQDTCSFVGGFARVRDLVGADKIGACLEDEHFNVENGNTEQRTTGGLLVWRKADNFTAFTDGGTTWVNGPDGLQSRPNAERFAWETDPTTLANTATVAPLPTVAASPSPVTASAGAGTTTTAGAAAATTAPAPIPVASPVAVAATPTKAATPTPAVTVKFTEKPDSVETGNDAFFEIQTNQKKGDCSLTITYNDSDPTPIASEKIDDDGKCEFKWTLAEKTKTGKARAQAIVSTPAGAANVDDDFDVKKGDTLLGGSIDMELEAEDLPEDDVKPGEEIKISIKTHLDKKGTCDASIQWPKSPSTPTWSGAQLNPDGDGKCAWKTVVPTDFTKKTTATLTIVIRKKKDDPKNLRVLVKKFDVKV